MTGQDAAQEISAKATVKRAKAKVKSGSFEGLERSVLVKILVFLHKQLSIYAAFILYSARGMYLTP